MLERNDVKALINHAWADIGCGVQVPDDFFDRSGRAAMTTDERRRFARYYVRERATLVDGRTLHCVYTSNVSRSGVAFLHLEQLFPKQVFQIFLPTGIAANICIERCRRIGPFCYECGAAFVGVKHQPEENALRKAAHQRGFAQMEHG